MLFGIVSILKKRNATPKKIQKEIRGIFVIFIFLKYHAVFLSPFVYSFI